MAPGRLNLRKARPTGKLGSSRAGWGWGFPGPTRMLSCGGILLLLLGVLVLWLARDSEGLTRSITLVLGILLCVAGLWYALFETGEGLARFLPSLRP